MQQQFQQACAFGITLQDMEAPPRAVLISFPTAKDAMIALIVAVDRKALGLPWVRLAA